MFVPKLVDEGLTQVEQTKRLKGVSKVILD
jgi:hypothetical protein